MPTTETKVRKPIHETIVDAINRASNRELKHLAMLIKATIITEGHDKIIEAWEERICAMSWWEEGLGVSASLLDQKQASLASALESPEGPSANKLCDECGTGNFNFHEIKQVAKRLVALLEDPHPDLATWNEALTSSSLEIHKLTEPACDK